MMPYLPVEGSTITTGTTHTELFNSPTPNCILQCLSYHLFMSRFLFDGINKLNMLLTFQERRSLALSS